MNRHHMGVIFVLLGFVLTVAGVAATGPVWLGVHGGISIPDLRGSETDIFSQGFTSRLGPFFGVSAEFELASRFSLVTGLNYTSQGGQRTGLQIITDIPSGVPSDMPLYANFKNETILDYIELPLLGRMTFGNKVRFFLTAGPYVGYLVRAKAVTSGSSLIYLDEAGTQPIVPSPISFDAKTDVIDSLKRWNAGLYGGVGVGFMVGPGDIVLEAHFQLGLLRIQKDVATSGDTKTGAVVVSVGYSFPLKKK